MKIVFIAKTNLNNDGRILNELGILQSSFSDISIDFILLPDIPLEIDLGEKVRVHNIKPRIRHNKFLRFFTVIEFSIRSLVWLFKLKPDIIHTHDSAVVLPVLIYRLFRKKFFKLIYDDHEISNPNMNLESKFNAFFEIALMKKADFVIFANEERMEILNDQHKLKNKSSYFLNLSYFEDQIDNLQDKNLKRKLSELDSQKLNGIKFIIHQGVLGVERGRKELAEFSRKLPADFKILLLGGSKNDYDMFLEEFKLKKDNFYFIGSVNYLVLPKFWDRGVASIVIYLPTYINNRLCAPNRLYMSIQKGLPVIVNKRNPVLSNFINKYNCGFYIEEIKEDSDFRKIMKLKDVDFTYSYDKLKEEQINNLVSIYK